VRPHFVATSISRPCDALTQIKHSTARHHLSCCGADCTHFCSLVLAPLILSRDPISVSGVALQQCLRCEAVTAVECSLSHPVASWVALGGTSSLAASWWTDRLCVFAAWEALEGATMRASWWTDRLCVFAAWEALGGATMRACPR